MTSLLGQQTATIHDLGAIGQFSRKLPTPIFPIPVAEPFAPKEKFARQYERDNTHGDFTTALITSTTGLFGVNLQFLWLPAATGQIFAQRQRGPDITEVSCSILNPNKIAISLTDTTTQSKNILSITQNLAGAYDVTKYLDLFLRFDGLNSGGSSVKVFVNGIDVANNVGYQINSSKGGGGVDVFAGGSLVNEFSIGNYSSGSTVDNGGCDANIGHFDIYDNNPNMTDQNILDTYNANKALIDAAAVNRDEDRRKFIVFGYDGK
jgi:hypothetical protein